MILGKNLSIKLKIIYKKTSCTGEPDLKKIVNCHSFFLCFIDYTETALAFILIVV